MIIQSNHLHPHLHPPISTHHTPRRPPPILRTQHPHDTRNLTRKRRPTTPHLFPNQRLLLRRQPLLHLPIPFLHHRAQRRRILKTLHLPPEPLARGEVHVPDHRPGVNRVDGGRARELARPRPRHRFQGGLRPAIHRLPREAHRGGHGGDVDDARGALAARVAGGREVRGQQLGEEERRQDVDGVVPVEVGGVDGALDGVVEEAVLRDAGVVDEDVDAELLLVVGRLVLVLVCRGEMLQRGSEDGLCGGLGVAQVCLDRVAADGVRGGQRGAEGLGSLAGGLGGEVEEERAAFGGEVAGDGLANACVVSMVGVGCSG